MNTPAPVHVGPRCRTPGKPPELSWGAFAEDTAMAQAPAARGDALRQEFRTRHVTLKVRRTAVICCMGAGRCGRVGRRGELDINWRKGSPNEMSERTEIYSEP